MPHQFTQNDGPELQGVWLKNNGRRYCSWLFDRRSGELRASRGTVVHTLNLEPVDNDDDAMDEMLKEKLPGLVLELVSKPRPH